MSIGAMAAEISADLHSLVSATDVYRKIITAGRYHREKKLWFSQRTFAFTLTQGKSAYSLGDGPPLGLTEIVGKVIYLLYGGSQDDRRSILRVPTAEFERTKVWGTSQSQPTVWDFWNKQLRFYPTPISATDTGEGRYVADLGVPVVKWEGGAFVFYSRDQLHKLTTTELDAFDSDLFNERGTYHAVRQRAMYLLYAETLKDQESANVALNGWLESVAMVDDESEARSAGAVEIQGSILGDGGGGGLWGYDW